jgi:predicted acetyltransferase
MLVESFGRMQARGEVISSLYPTTSLLYASVGYAVAGEFAHRRVPLRAIGPAQSLDWSECELGCEEVRRIQRTEANRHDGWVLPSPLWWDYQAWRRSAPPADRVFCWLGRRDDEPVAAVVYTYGDDERTLYHLAVQLLTGVDAGAVRSALSFLASNGSTADVLDTTVPAPVLDVALARPELAKVDSDWPWMLRIIDLEGAIAARGYRPGSVSVDLDVTDDIMQHNHGAWTLRVADGIGRVVRGGEATVAIDIADLARIYAGADPRLLHDDGRITGTTPLQLDQLAGVFATRATLPIFF